MSEIATLNKSILGLSGNIENFIKSLGNMETRATSVNKKVKELTKAQEVLGLKYRDNIRGEQELFNPKTKLRVDRFGSALGEAGKKMTSFNKRTGIISESIKELNKTNERFNLGFKSFSTYTKMGGNAFEYLAEFISSGREEITIFGVEAAKARKFLYGFLPSGVFRMLNKFSSTLQLVGGQYRKLVTDSGAAKEEVEKLKIAIENFNGDPDELKGLKKRLEELEVPDGIFSKVFKGFGKMKKFVSKPLQINFDKDGIYEMDKTHTKTVAAMGIKVEEIKETYSNLWGNAKKMQQDYQKGVDTADAVLGIETSMGKGIELIAKAEKDMEALITRAELFPDNADYFDSVVQQQEKINQLLEQQDNLQTALTAKTAEGLGLQGLKAKINLQENEVKEKEKFIKLMDLDIQKHREQIELIKLDNAQTPDPANAIRIAAEEEQIAMKISQQEEARPVLEKEQAKLGEAKEQLEVLKEMRENSIDKLLEKHPFFKGINKLRKGFKSIMPALKTFLKAFLMGFVYVSIAILGVLALVKTFGPIIKDTIGTVIKLLTPILKWTMAAVSLIFEGIGQVFNAFFGDGTMSDAIDGLLKIGAGILGTIITLAIAALVALGTLLVAGIGHAIKRIGAFFKEMFSSWKGFLKNFGVILAIAGTIVALIMGAPVWLAVVIGLVIFRVGKMLIDPIVKLINFIKKGIENLNPAKKVGKYLAIRDKMKSRATGGIVGIGETTLVGENGPELVKLPAGSKVYTNTRTRQMAGNSSNANNTINITINAKDTSDAEMRRIAEKVGRFVNNSINRNTGMSGIR
jgi:hypothetical protein